MTLAKSGDRTCQHPECLLPDGKGYMPATHHTTIFGYICQDCAIMSVLSGLRPVKLDERTADDDIQDARVAQVWEE